MQEAVYRRYLTRGEQTFAERQRDSLQIHPNSPRNEKYRQSGGSVFESYQQDPVGFMHLSGVDVSQSPSRKATEVVEVEKQGNPGDLLDSLVDLPSDRPAPQQLFEAEQLVYEFEEAEADAPFSQTLLERPVLHGRPLDQDSHEAFKDGELPRVEEKLISSVASATELDIGAGGRLTDRVDRKSNFAALQEHIYTLTEENCDLKRALELQQRLTSNLTKENQTLGDEYNIQAQKLEELKMKAVEYEHLIQEQQEGLAVLKREHEQSMAAEQGARERVKALVQENVTLEDRLRDLRVSEIRLTKMVEELKEETEAVKKQERRSENENRHLSDILNNIREENNVLRSQIKLPEAQRKSETASQSSLHKQSDTKVAKKMLNADVQVDIPDSPATPSLIPTPSHEREMDITDEEILRTFASQQDVGLCLEERQVLSSVHELINALDDQRKAMIARLRVAKAENRKVEAENRDLRSKIAVQIQLRETQAQKEIERKRMENGGGSEPRPPSTMSLSKDRSQNRFLGGFFKGRKEKTVRDYID